MISVGDKFGRLTAVEFVWHQYKDRRRYVWKCQCECGAEKLVSPTALSSGASKSCGCLRSELQSHRQTKHGHSVKGQWSKTYYTWSGMIARCSNPNHRSWKYYGALGVKVCDRWQHEEGFENFLADMGERPEGKTLDRVNPFGD